jgi:hypothetical protein
MIRQISSRLTFFYKFILPGIFALSIINIGIQYLTGWSLGPFPGITGIIILWPVSLMILSILFLSPLKKIYVDERNLYVSDYRTDATIPVTNIERISETFLSEPRRVTIHFKEPTIFGEKVVFIAAYRFVLFPMLRSHPIVSELREMVSSS